MSGEGSTDGGGLRVQGGAGGVEASYLDLQRLGGIFGSVADEITSYAWTDKLKAADGDLLASAVLSPGTAAEAEGAILAATLGPNGLLPQAVVLEVKSFVFSVVVDVYRFADDALEKAINTMVWGMGAAVALSPMGFLPLTAGFVVMGLATGQYDLVGKFGKGAVDGIAARPDAKFLTGLFKEVPMPGPANGIAGDLWDGLYESSRPGEIRTDSVPSVHQQVPNGLGDVTRGINQASGPSGRFTVQEITGADGSSRWIVHLPGTDFGDWDSARDFTGNIQLLNGDRTAYGDAVGQALADAGVGPQDPVLLAGHSQGGMQAMQLADDPEFGYHVAGVYTVGSASGNVEAPENVPVLNVENTYDPVPYTDGEPGEIGPEHVVVTVDDPQDSLLENHSLENVYAPTADMIDGSTDPSVQHVLEQWQADGFLGDSAGVESTTHTYQAVVAEN